MNIELTETEAQVLRSILERLTLVPCVAAPLVDVSAVPRTRKIRLQAALNVLSAMKGVAFECGDEALQQGFTEYPAMAEMLLSSYELTTRAGVTAAAADAAVCLSSYVKVSRTLRRLADDANERGRFLAETGVGHGMPVKVATCRWLLNDVRELL